MAKSKTGESRPGAGVADAEWIDSLRRRLPAWFRRHQRQLPWRETSDPYAIWVSEIMLQQTQVATVVPYFTRFLAAFPTIRDLAAADENEVLRHWEGLGYYRRARQMHRTARVVVEEHDGIFPHDLAAVRTLPGIGRYTAGAIVSIAFDIPAPILEANTVRLLSRLIGLADDAQSTASQKLLWSVAEAIVPRRGAGTLNQALMELGSLLCTPRTPRCLVCPLGELCQARRTGQQEQIPKTRAKPVIEAVNEAAVVVRREGKILLRQRAAGERWAGLWDFLRFEIGARRGAKLERELIDKVQRHSGLLISPPSRITTLKHGVTRFRITLDCYEAQSLKPRQALIAGTWKWVRPAELERFPLSVTGRKLGRLLLSP